MTRFKDGPAKGKNLCLARTPLLLRVVIDASDKVDALDQFDDVPEPGEVIHVYRRVPGTKGSCHVSFSDKGRRRGAWYACAEYVLAENQPDDVTARDTALWRAWCQEQVTPPKGD